MSVLSHFNLHWLAPVLYTSQPTDALPPCCCSCLPLTRPLPPAGLVSLDLNENRWPRVPPALAAATRLTELSLARNCFLALSAADVDGVLCSLPRLRRLYLDIPQMPAD